MSISGVQLAGIVLGSIPIVSIPTGIIKFFVYLKKENGYTDMMKRVNVENVAEQVNGTAKQIRDTSSSDISNLKWYALAQVVPLVGIYFAQKERGALHRMNYLEASIQPKEDVPVGELLLDPEKPATTLVKSTPNTIEEYDNVLTNAHGNAILYFTDATLGLTQMNYTILFEEELSKHPEITQLITIDKSNTQIFDSIFAKYRKIEKFPTICVLEEYKEVNATQGLENAKENIERLFVVKIHSESSSSGSHDSDSDID